MNFLENEGDFMDFEDEKDIIRCEECGYEWEAGVDDEPSHCPECDIEFI